MRKNMRQIAEEMRQKGQGGDTVLAHINPEEARMLGQFGHDINPETGLPQFSRFWKKLGRKIVKPFERLVKSAKKDIKLTLRHPKKALKKFTPALTAAASMAMGIPPAYAIGLGALANTTTVSGPHKLRAALKGAGQAAMFASVAPALTARLGVSPDSFLGRMSGLDKPSLMASLGSDANKTGGGLGFFDNVGNEGLADKFLSGNYNMGWAGTGLGKYAPAALKSLGGTAIDMLSGRKGRQPEEELEQEPEEYMDYEEEGPSQEYYNQRSGMGNYGQGYQQEPELDQPGAQSSQYQSGIPQWMIPGFGGGNGSSYEPLNTLNQFSPDFNSGKSAFDIAKEKMIGNPTEDKRSKKKKGVRNGKRYASGGHIKESDTGGREDDIERTLPEGAYVVNATAASLLGDGSTDNGIKKLKAFDDSFIKSGFTKSYDEHSKGVKAFVSNDEFVVSPRTVSALGKGNNQRGAKVMDRMVSNLIKHKGVKNILPPRSKSIESYLSRSG